ncbi:MAG: PorT family protein [Treponema sp.]|nr:PorT family protein [Treponema sp.]
MRVIGVPAVRVYIAPMKDGTVEEQEYFADAMEREFAGAAYQVVDFKEDSDYYVELSVSQDESSRFVTIVLFDTKSGREVVSLGRDYQDFAEMEDWNLYLITQATSNLPIIKLPPNAELLAMPGGEGGKAAPKAQPFKSGFYLGLRVGGFLSNSMFQISDNYEGGLSQGLTGEGAVRIEFRFIRFLSFQAEAVFIYDTFNAMKRTQIGLEAVRSTETFWHLSLMFPLLIKVPVEVDRFTLSPFVGAYYIMSLWPVNRAKGDSDEEAGTYSYNVDLPLGVSLGIDAGLVLGPGEIFVGLRFDQNLGMTVVGDRNGPHYYRSRIGLSLGYEFLLGKGRR